MSSNFNEINCGILHSLTLIPLLFILYQNDLRNRSILFLKTIKIAYPLLACALVFVIFAYACFLVEFLTVFNCLILVNSVFFKRHFSGFGCIYIKKFSFNLKKYIFMC